ncbi:MAG: hypothetical protein FJ026_00505 [Chloroflexi bacterium]|nr:hypothetical protein [Chloroflexota bacterium]
MGMKEIFVDIPQITLEEQEKYAGMDVAIVNGKVITAGHNSVEVYERARELFPDKDPEEIVIRYITKPGMLIL